MEEIPFIQRIKEALDTRRGSNSELETALKTLVIR